MGFAEQRATVSGRFFRHTCQNRHARAGGNDTFSDPDNLSE
jgi:hypothetical protein